MFYYSLAVFSFSFFSEPSGRVHIFLSFLALSGFPPVFCIICSSFFSSFWHALAPCFIPFFSLSLFFSYFLFLSFAVSLSLFSFKFSFRFSFLQWFVFFSTLSIFPQSIGILACTRKGGAIENGSSMPGWLSFSFIFFVSLFVRLSSDILGLTNSLHLLCCVLSRLAATSNTQT